MEKQIWKEKIVTTRAKLNTTAERSGASFIVLTVVAGTGADAFRLKMAFLIEILCKSMFFCFY